MQSTAMPGRTVAWFCGFLLLACLVQGNGPFGADDRATEDDRATGVEEVRAEPGQFLFFAARDQQGTVSPSTGKFALSVVDLSEPRGPSGFEFRRSLTDGRDPPGILGRKWTSNWETRLVGDEDNLRIVDDLSETMLYRGPEANTLWSPQGDKLSIEGNHTRRIRPDGVVERFDDGGRLVQRQIGGVSLSLTYGAGGRLARIDGPDETFLQFEYGGAHMVRVRNSAGSSVAYTYEGDNLAEVQPQAEARTRYAYSENGRLAEIAHSQFGAIRITYDERGRVLTRSWGDGSTERLEYDDEAHAVRHVAADGAVTTTRFDAVDRRVYVTDPTGREVSMKLNHVGRVEEITGPTGEKASFVYDDQMRLSAITGSDESTVQFLYHGSDPVPSHVMGQQGLESTTQYDAEGRMSKVRVGADLETSFGYDAEGRPNSIRGSTGPGYKLAYDPKGRLTEITNDLGDTMKLEYDARGNLVRRTGHSGHVEKRTYDEAGRLTSETDASGATTRYEYTASGLLAAVIDPQEAVTRYAYHGRTVSITDPLGNVSTLHYSPTGRLEREVDPLGNTTRYEYDPHGNLLRSVNPAGGVTSYAYGPLGRLVSVKEPDGGTTKYEYNDAGQLAAVIDSFGQRTVNEYDEEGRLSRTLAPDGTQIVWDSTSTAPRVEKVVPPAGPALEYGYDSRGNVTQVWRGDALLGEYEYDALDRPVKQRTGQGLVASYQYDAAGNLIGWEDSLGGKGTTEYDGPGRPIVESTNGLVTRRQYDVTGDLESTQTGAGTTRQEHDLAGQLTRIETPAGRRADYEYDAAGNLLSAASSPGARITFAYDSLGNVTSLTDALGRSTRSRYDAAGRLIATTDAAGGTISYGYDATGQLVEKRLPDGSSIKYGYDAKGNLVSVDDGKFPVNYRYDEHGRRSEISYPTIQRKLTYRYDAESGQLAAFTDSEGRTLNYQYDHFGRLSAIQVGEGQAFSFEYDAADRLVRMVYPNGVTGQWRYDVKGNLVGIVYYDEAGTPLDAVSYTYDDANRLIRKESGATTTTYRYDPDGRLLEERVGQRTPVKYQCDGDGNRWTREDGAGRVEYLCDAAGQLFSAGSASFEYDANGNLVRRIEGDAVTQYGYDCENQLTEVILPNGDAVRYGYAPTGERVWREDASGRVYYVTDGEHVWAELDQDLEPTASYVHGLAVDQPLMLSRGEQSYFYHADMLGTVTALSDAKGARAARYAYDAFGAEATPDSPAIANPFRYTGREWDAATGLYYYRARYYDPKLGRFLSVDPEPPSLEEPQSLNAYVYAYNRPTQLTDPWGNIPKWARAAGFHQPLLSPHIRGPTLPETQVAVTSPRVPSGSECYPGGFLPPEKEFYWYREQVNIKGPSTSIPRSAVDKTARTGSHRVGHNTPTGHGPLPESGVSPYAPTKAQRLRSGPGGGVGCSSAVGDAIEQAGTVAGAYGAMLHLTSLGTDHLRDFARDWFAYDRVTSHTIKDAMQTGCWLVMGTAVGIVLAPMIPTWLLAGGAIYGFGTGIQEIPVIAQNLADTYDYLQGRDPEAERRSNLSPERATALADLLVGYSKMQDELEEIKMAQFVANQELERAKRGASLVRGCNRDVNRYVVKLRDLRLEMGNLPWLRLRAETLSQSVSKNVEHCETKSEQACELLMQVVEEAEGGCDDAKYERLRAKIGQAIPLVKEVRVYAFKVAIIDRELRKLHRERHDAYQVYSRMRQVLGSLQHTVEALDSTLSSYAESRSSYSFIRNTCNEKLTRLKRKAQHWGLRLEARMESEQMPEESRNELRKLYNELKRELDSVRPLPHANEVGLKDFSVSRDETKLRSPDLDYARRAADEAEKFVEDAHKAIPATMPSVLLDQWERVRDAVNKAELALAMALESLYKIEQTRHLTTLSELAGLTSDAEKPGAGSLSELAGLTRNAETPQGGLGELSGLTQDARPSGGREGSMPGRSQPERRPPPQPERRPPPQPARRGVQPVLVSCGPTKLPIAVISGVAMRITSDGKAALSPINLTFSAGPYAGVGKITFHKYKIATRPSGTGGPAVPVQVTFEGVSTGMGTNWAGGVSQAEPGRVTFQAVRQRDGSWALHGGGNFPTLVLRPPRR